MLSDRGNPLAIFLIEAKGRSENLFIFKFIRYRLIFAGHPSQAHLQSRVGVVASEPAASVRFFSKIA